MQLLHEKMINNSMCSTAFVTDQNRTVTQGFLYAPFGEITTEYNAGFASSALPKYTFNAKELDEETGMYYYEARYYNPPVFVSRDALFEKYFWISPYAYCANNPMKYVDPTGYEFDPTQDANHIKPLQNALEAEREKRLSERNKYAEGTSEWNRLNDQYTDLDNAWNEINTLRNDPDNMYLFNFGSAECSNNNAGGLLSYGGIKDGKSLIIMHIGAKEAFSSSGIKLHELKHAYQYFEGRLGFFVENLNTPSANSTNCLTFEKEAHYRASVFAFATTVSFEQYKFCTQTYRNLERYPSHSGQHHAAAKAMGMIYINNRKTFDPYAK